MGEPRHADDSEDRTPEYVRSALQEAAQGYRPRRSVMASRVATGRAGTRPETPRRSRTAFRMLPAGAALAVAVILLFSVVAVRSAGDNRRDTGPPAAAPAQTTTAPASRPASARPGSVPATKPARSASGGFLTSGGAVDANSVATWSQDNVTITSSKKIVSLVVTIRVGRTAGTADAGRYTTVPNADMTMTVERDASALVYTYALKNGVTLVPGTFVFAAQFQHRPGRRSAGDSYTVVARTTADRADLAGTFG
jgi:hypothetical protein